MKAFPNKTIDKISFGRWNEDISIYEQGMDLRDYFAAKAMQAIITRFPNEQGGWKEDYVADSAYFMADAMMKAREQ